MLSTRRAPGPGVCAAPLFANPKARADARAHDRSWTMTRTLAAAALAAIVLPAAALQAAAAPGVVTTLGKTYTLECALNASDGEALKVRMMVKNTTGGVIKKDTPITIRFVYG